MQKRDIKFLIFWLKRPLKSRIFRFFLKTRFLLQKTFKIIDFLSFSLVGRRAVRPYGRSLFVEFWGCFFLPFFHEIPFKMAFLKLRYMTFFSCMLRLLEPLIAYFDYREKLRLYDAFLELRHMCQYFLTYA